MAYYYLAGVIVTSEQEQNSEQFISEPITPEVGSFSTELMARGLAALPGAFTWRDKRYEVVNCMDHFKETSTEGGKAKSDRYLRRQVFVVELNTGEIAKLYVLRQGASAGSSKAKKQRWYLYSITGPKNAQK